jgi:MinD-like ATPase involved in chromosome partitioning or flagellar assembly
VSFVALLSAKHSPGATTAAVALASIWPRGTALVAECDPAGGDLAALTGVALEPGLTSLAASHRHGFNAVDLTAHAQLLPCGVRAVVAPPSPEGTRAALATLAERLAPNLAALDATDVFADCGRFDPASPALPILEAADLVLLLARPTLAGVEHVAGRLDHVRRHASRLGVLLIGDRPYPAGEVSAYLACEVVGVIADDPAAAAGLVSAAPPRRLDRSLLLRSARSTADSLVAALSPLSGRGSPTDPAVASPVKPLATTWPGQR